MAATSAFGRTPFFERRSAGMTEKNRDSAVNRSSDKLIDFAAIFPLDRPAIPALLYAVSSGCKLLPMH